MTGRCAGDGGTGGEAGSDRGEGDVALVRRAARGDRDALGALYARYQERCLTWATALCGPDLAEDVVQDLFAAHDAPADGARRGPAPVPAWLREFAPGRGELAGWLFGVTRRRALAARRRAPRTLPDPFPGPLCPDGPPEDQLARAELAALVREALLRLPPGLRDLAILQRSHTQREIAAATGLSRATVSRRVAELRARLAELLPPAVVAPHDPPASAATHPFRPRPGRAPSAGPRRCRDCGAPRGAPVHPPA